MGHADRVATDAEPTTISVARVYDYLLGGNSNYAVDRAAAEQLKTHFPELADWAWCNRGFHQRAARWLAAEVGIRQFLDIGSGLPTQVNTHEVVRMATGWAGDARAGSEAPRVMYVDNDAEVVSQATRLLAGVQNTSFVRADLRRPDELLGHPGVRGLIDFTQPVALLITAVVHFVADRDDPWGLVAHCMDALPSGSYLVLSQGTADKMRPESAEAARAVYDKANEQGFPRSRPEVERFFAKLELVPPHRGAMPEVTFGGLWGAEDPELADDEASRRLYAGVARKP